MDPGAVRSAPLCHIMLANKCHLILCKGKISATFINLLIYFMFHVSAHVLYEQFNKSGFVMFSKSRTFHIQTHFLCIHHQALEGVVVVWFCI